MARNSFGEKLKLLRKSKNLTQAQLAELADANAKHISKIETGVYFPTYATLTKILQALDLRIEDVGLDLSSRKNNDNPYYLKIMQILNNANENEYEYYYGFLKQAQKGLELIQPKLR